MVLVAGTVTAQEAPLDAGNSQLEAARARADAARVEQENIQLRALVAQLQANTPEAKAKADAAAQALLASVKNEWSAVCRKGGGRWAILIGQVVGADGKAGTQRWVGCVGK